MSTEVLTRGLLLVTILITDRKIKHRQHPHHSRGACYWIAYNTSSPFSSTQSKNFRVTYTYYLQLYWIYVTYSSVSKPDILLVSFISFNLKHLTKSFNNAKCSNYSSLIQQCLLFVFFNPLMTFFKITLNHIEWNSCREYSAACFLWFFWKGAAQASAVINSYVSSQPAGGAVVVARGSFFLLKSGISFSGTH